MNWDAVGAIGSILGAIAVVVTLFYLAAQMRQNTRAMRASARQALIDTFYDHVWEMGRDAELSDLIGRGLSDFDALSDTERARFDHLLSRWEGNLLNGLLLHEAKLLDTETLNLIGDRFVATVQTKGGSAWYALAGASPAVATFIERRIAEARAEIVDAASLKPWWIYRK